MLKRTLFVILLSLAIIPMTYALPQPPNEAVVVRLYVHAEFDESSAATYPIKRQPSMGITAYVSDGIVYVQEFNESFTLRLIDMDSSVEVFSSTVLPGKTIVTLPQDLLGDFFINFDFPYISYRGDIHL